MTSSNASWLAAPRLRLFAVLREKGIGTWNCTCCWREIWSALSWKQQDALHASYPLMWCVPWCLCTVCMLDNRHMANSTMWYSHTSTLLMLLRKQCDIKLLIKLIEPSDARYCSVRCCTMLLYGQKIKCPSKWRNFEWYTLFVPYYRFFKCHISFVLS